MGTRLHLRGGVGRCAGEAGPGEYRQIEQVVTHIRDRAVVERGGGQHPFVCVPLAGDAMDDPPDAECIDAYLRPYDRNDGVEAAMREYLSWEIDLVRQVARDGDARFGLG